MSETNSGKFDVERTIAEVNDDHQDFYNRVAYHPATEDTAILHDRLRKLIARAGHDVINALPRSRERSLALTHLEEALMWANKGVALLGPVDDEHPDVARQLPIERRDPRPDTTGTGRSGF